MRLSWALTIWKSQGQTIRSKIVLHLGNEETENGLTYTAVSRPTRFSDVGLFDGFEASRFLKKFLSIRKWVQDWWKKKDTMPWLKKQELFIEQF